MSSVSARIYSKADSLITELLEPHYGHNAVVIALCLSVSVGNAFMLLAPSTLYTNIMLHDAFVMFSGIYRVSQGQIPHIDFHTALGALNFVGPQIFAEATGSIIDGTIYYYVTESSIGIIISYFLVINRIPFLPRIILLIYMINIAMSPFLLGASTGDVTFAMYYNRLCWILLILISVWAFVGKDESETQQKIWGSFIVCFIGIVLFYTKITYLIAFLFILFCSLFVKRKNIIPIFGGGSIAGLTVLLTEIASPGFHYAYVSNLYDTLIVSKGFKNYFEIILRNYVGFAFFVSCLLLTFWAARGSREGYGWRVLFPASVLFGVSILVFSQNAQRASLPLLAVVPLICIEFLMRGQHMQTVNRAPLNLLAISLLFGMWALPEIAAGQFAAGRFYVMSTNSDFAYTFNVPEKIEQLRVREGGDAKIALAQNLERRGEISSADENWQAIFRTERGGPKQQVFQDVYLYTVAAGVDVMRNIVSKHGDGAIVVLDFANPMPWLLGSPTARGEMLWYHYGRNFDLSYFVAPEKLFEDVKYVMDPKLPAVGQSEARLYEIYGPYIRENFTAVADGLFWTVWQRERVP